MNVKTQEHVDLIQAIVQIVNEELAGSEFSDIAVKDSDFRMIGDPPFAILDDQLNNWCTTILDRVCPDLRQSCRRFYHFRGADKAIEILRRGYLEAWGLPSHSLEDKQEVSRFLQIFGAEDWLASEQEAWYGKAEVSRLDDWRAGIHILCMSNAPSEYLWNKFGDMHAGVALVMELKEVDDSELANLQPMYDFRRVTYDNGSRFAFMSRIRERVSEIASGAVVCSQIPRFAKFHKGLDKCAEDEVRLSFDQKYCAWTYKRHLFDEMHSTYYRSDVNPDPEAPRVMVGHLNVPLLDLRDSRHDDHPMFSGLKLHSGTPWFSLCLSSVILGHEIEQEKARVLTDLISRNYPTATIAKETEATG